LKQPFHSLNHAAEHASSLGRWWIAGTHHSA
jgi:hypothetical protein